jgi:hypothetical protein
MNNACTDIKQYILLQPWIRLYGIWVAYGCKLNKDNQIVIDFKNEWMKQYIFNSINHLQLPFKTYGSTVTILQNLKFSPNNFPNWIWETSMSQSRDLINIMCLTKYTFITQNKNIVDDFMRLCLHAGWCGVSSYDEESNEWKIIVDTTGIIESSNDDICEKDFNGMVYCLRVPTEIFYVRRNGKCCWTGNSRASAGPIVMLTRQPAEGRARDGGLRMGEMEVECNWGHGILQFLKERMMDCSDNYKIHTCKKCGLMGTVNVEKKIAICKNCKNNHHFAEVRIPYACKLLFQEIQTMSIVPRFYTT